MNAEENEGEDWRRGYVSAATRCVRASSNTAVVDSLCRDDGGTYFTPTDSPASHPLTVLRHFVSRFGLAVRR